ncbi:TagK domain-containing protein [Enterobacteriaceae bacterium 4M9]|nr:TagK domain-containing protein [Enterobacteriaceae bacterium 4M9]
MTNVLPEGGQELILDEGIGSAREHYFHIDEGFFCSEFSSTENYVVFSWGESGPELRNESSVSVCSCNGVLIPEGETMALQYNMDIQIGNYLFQTEVSSSVSLQKELVKGFCSSSSRDDFPELDDLLGEQSYYSGVEDEIYILNRDGVLDDELRRLRYEYKEYLQWGDQKRDFISQGIEHTVKLPANDAYLESVVNNVKDKTMTECILGQTSLIDRAMSEIGSDEQLNNDDEVRGDLLYLLAPEHVSRKEKKVLSETIYHELRKPELNSYL